MFQFIMDMCMSTQLENLTLIWNQLGIHPVGNYFLKNVNKFRFKKQLRRGTIAGRDEWIPLFSDIRIVGYLDSWIPWMVRYHGYLDNE